MKSFIFAAVIVCMTVGGGWLIGSAAGQVIQTVTNHLMVEVK